MSLRGVVPLARNDIEIISGFPTIVPPHDAPHFLSTKSPVCHPENLLKIL
jgi:hypothetical protein